MKLDLKVEILKGRRVLRQKTNVDLEELSL